MRPLVVLMYHGLYGSEKEYLDITAADRPYAVSTERFEQHMDALQAASVPILDPAALFDPKGGHGDEGGVVLTFDDGHGSNHSHAWPILAKRRQKAIFFVTSDFIGQRPGFCDWVQLREMADEGMTVASHGRTHRFLSDLPADEAVAELRDSKRAIEDHVGQWVDQVSFPGGRYRDDLIPAWQDLGYRAFHSSRIGAVQKRPAQPGAVLPRLAIKNSTTAAQCLQMGRADGPWLFKAALLAQAKQLAKRAAGNQLYQKLYEQFHPHG